MPPRKFTKKPPIDAATESKIVEEAPANKRSGKKKLLLLIAGMFFVLLTLVLVGAYFYKDYVLQGSGSEALDNPEDIVKKVRSIMVLPENETPQVATVTDKSQLGERPFFNRAVNEDKLLIFTSANIAVLYRPSVDKIVNVAPISQNPEGVTLPGQNPNINISVTPSPAEPVDVVILNGTRRSGLASQAKDKVEAEGSNYEVLRVGNAAGEYEETLVVDVTGKNAQSVDTLVKIIGGKKASLPEEETAGGAEVLILLGDNFEN